MRFRYKKKTSPKRGRMIRSRSRTIRSRSRSRSIRRSRISHRNRSIIKNDYIEDNNIKKVEKVNIKKVNKRKMNNVVVYTDGSAEQHKYAGIGVYFGENDERNISEPFYIFPLTNNRAELYAVIKSIETFASFKKDKTLDKLIIYSDSEYVIKSLTIWIKKWKLNNWKTAGGKDVLNKDLIFWLDNIIELHKDYIAVEFHHIKELGFLSHSSEPRDKTSEKYKAWYGNKMADELAQKGRDMASK